MTIEEFFARERFKRHATHERTLSIDPKNFADGQADRFRRSLGQLPIEILKFPVRAANALLTSPRTLRGEGTTGVQVVFDSLPEQKSL